MIAITVMLLWLGHLVYTLSSLEADPTSPWTYLHVLVQAYLYTGLFITGHDAMHGTVTKSRTGNRLMGYLSSILFAGLWYPRLKKNHWRHHVAPASDEDPDYYTGSRNFFVWWAVFMIRYVTIWQLLFMAIVFNILKIWVGVPELIVFWIVPAFLSTFQLFFFGTFLPHRRPHTEEMDPHKARTQKKNHLWAMLSCYFFGYHHEHHGSPRTPWWQLYKLK